MPAERFPDTPHPNPLPQGERGAEGRALAPFNLAALGIEGMIGAVCDPNDPESCEVPPAMLAQLTSDAAASAEDAR